ncbi:aminopeptidase P family protein [Kitasatospora sp. NBC_01246]|uniref:M24 family metallopeptidase n=1 Tax=Kitasatospora sp. NBC_01246 TaxID=2903570 RepID=UPI002E37B6AF|nr:M24 family metallopeptidase [Kitasatospora sp. NBC_01246]
MAVEPSGAQEVRRVEGLVSAQEKAIALFAEAEARELVAPGVGEREASDRIRDLANEMFGATRHWHKRIIRSGPNTLAPYRDNPPDRVIGADDVAFADFGPVFEEYEADFGRTYVFGGDPHKRRLLADLPRIFDAGRAFFAADPEITGRQLHAEVERLAAEAGWEVGIWHAGHLVGEFPHEVNDGAKADSYITPENETPLRRTDRSGRVCHWILELHLVDWERGFGGFYEQLLDLA